MPTIALPHTLSRVKDRLLRVLGGLTGPKLALPTTVIPPIPRPLEPRMYHAVLNSAAPGGCQNMPHHSDATDRRSEDYGVQRAGLLIVTLTDPSASLAAETLADMRATTVTSFDAAEQALQARHYKLIVVECPQTQDAIVRGAMRIRRMLPEGSASALLVYQASEDGTIDLLRYTPQASAFAFLAARDHQLRAHVLAFLKN
ncbi:hypothetical protein [Celeribacter baekdonensis]|uniref:hypothetical protein n=1 Tax=Celeribacter baekdonensis TaxID=875171 RepID=UPI003A8F3587